MNTFQRKAGMLHFQRIIAMNIQPKITPVLDPGFVPAVLWNHAFEAKAAADPASHQAMTGPASAGPASSFPTPEKTLP